MRYTAATLMRRFVKECVRAAIRVKPRNARTLTDLANLYGSDKGNLWFAKHGYTEIYERRFSSIRQTPLAILEIGLRYDAYYFRRSGTSPSLRMWLDYFPNARVCGFDINDFSSMNSDRVRIYQGDQGDRADLHKMLREIPVFNVVIDDGSHASYHQLVTLETLLPAVAPGGMYIIEDLDFHPVELERTLPKTAPMASLLRSSEFLATLGLSTTDVQFYLSDKLAIIAPPLDRPANG